MIITKYVNVPFNTYNKRFINICISYNENVIIVPIEHIKKSSHYIVEVKCDDCGTGNVIKYKEYNDRIKKSKKFICRKCSIKYRDETNIERYGCKNVMQNREVLEKMQDTQIEKNGKLAFQMPKSRRKAEETCIKRYGVKNPLQNIEIHKKQLKSAFKIKYFNEKLYYQGLNELKFLQHCKDLNIIDSIKNGLSIKYKYKKSDKIYHSDFYCEQKNLIIEIKSYYTYYRELEKNLQKKKPV